jgi:hypothetical protein
VLRTGRDLVPRYVASVTPARKVILFAGRPKFYGQPRGVRQRKRKVGRLKGASTARHGGCSLLFDQRARSDSQASRSCARGLNGVREGEGGDGASRGGHVGITATWRRLLMVDPVDTHLHLYLGFARIRADLRLLSDPPQLTGT